MRRGVGRGQRNRDDEAGRGKPQQRQHQRLALPLGEELFEDQDAALAVRAHGRDPVVHRQGAEQRQDDEHERRDRRERSGGQERDARLIGERREIVDAGEAHHLPPVGGVPGARVRAHRLGGAFEKPGAELLLEGNPGWCQHHRSLCQLPLKDVSATAVATVSVRRGHWPACTAASDRGRHRKPQLRGNARACMRRPALSYSKSLVTPDSYERRQIGTSQSRRAPQGTRALQAVPRPRVESRRRSGPPPPRR